MDHHTQILYVGSGDQTQVLVFSEQAYYQPRHLLGPEV